jgi:DNA-damage-inducible protein J
LLMSKSVTVQARMEPELKAKADVILASLGINASTAISLFYAQIVRHRGIPLELKAPNEETVAAINELKDPTFRKNTRRYRSAVELFEDLES